MERICAAETFFGNYNATLSIVIEIIGLVIAIVGVVYGRKAYLVAKEIFERGPQIDKKKVLEQLSLEFVIDFFIPLSKFKTATQDIWEGRYDQVSAIHVRDAIKGSTFSVQFPYFDEHKGEIWDSLTTNKTDDPSEEFKKIMEFVEQARNFDRIMNDLYVRLNEYIDPEKNRKRRRETNPMLKDFIETSMSVNQEIFSTGETMIGKLCEYEDSLPQVLNIANMKKNLFR